MFNSATEVAADKSMSILPANKPFPSTLPIKSLGNSNRDVIVPYSDPKRSMLGSAPIVCMPHALRSKPPKEVTRGHSQSSKPFTPSPSKSTVNLDNVRHPEVILDPNDISNMPRKSQILTQSTEHYVGIFRNIGNQTNVFYPGDEDHSGPNSSQPMPSKPADYCASSATISTVNN